MGVPVGASHCGRRDLSQRERTSGHKAVAPGSSRMRAPSVTGALCTAVTPDVTKAMAVTMPTATYKLTTITIVVAIASMCDQGSMTLQALTRAVCVRVTSIRGNLAR